MGLAMLQLRDPSGWMVASARCSAAMSVSWLVLATAMLARCELLRVTLRMLMVEAWMCLPVLAEHPSAEEV